MSIIGLIIALWLIIAGICRCSKGYLVSVGIIMICIGLYVGYISNVVSVLC